MGCYQMIFPSEITLESILVRLSGELTLAISSNFRKNVSRECQDALEKSLRDAIGKYVLENDLCGSRAICSENLEPAPCNVNSGSPVLEIRPWEQENWRRIHLNFPDLDLFFAELVRVTLSAFQMFPEGSGGTAPILVEGVVRKILGQHLYFNVLGDECELCEMANKLNPWRKSEGA